MFPLKASQRKLHRWRGRNSAPERSRFLYNVCDCTTHHLTSLLSSASINKTSLVHLLQAEHSSCLVCPYLMAQLRMLVSDDRPDPALAALSSFRLCRTTVSNNLTETRRQSFQMLPEHYQSIKCHFPVSLTGLESNTPGTLRRAGAACLLFPSVRNATPETAACRILH